MSSATAHHADRADAVMPFGCLALRDGRSYSSPTDITDKYEIGQVLKAKEFCELCLAKERQTDKVYVCKKFLKKDGKKVRKAAKNEIMILKLVNHPNILQLIDAFETRKEFYIIQELATGGDVFDWILDQGNYTERDASNVIRQVLEAVAYLHSLNIVHRNLKLENLMYYTENNHNKVVLRDFYLSKFENGSITEPCGTPEYLAPEVVARHRYGRPVDCWAVGVIMYILLSGNPPFYDETEEENTDLHNRIIFCRIVAGEFEFDSPYWDDISPAAKELVCRLMEVDPMLRITAQDALWHEWIAGNGASEKNLKEGVCAQFEKNFAKAKWRKAIRVTTFMQRLRNTDLGAAEGAEEDQAEGGGGDDVRGEGRQVDLGGVPVMSMSHEVTMENRPLDNQNLVTKKTEVEDQSVGKTPFSPTAGVSPSATTEPLGQKVPPSETPKEEPNKEPKKGVDEASCRTTTVGQEKPAAGVEQTPTESIMDAGSHVAKVAKSDPEVPQSSNGEKKPSSTAETTNRRKIAANLSQSLDQGPGGGSAARSKAPPVERTQPLQQEDQGEAGKTFPSSWCQTQLPEAVAEKPVLGEVSPRAREAEAGIAERSALQGKQSQGPYKGMSSPSLGRNKTAFVQEQRESSGASGFASPFTAPYGAGGGVVYSGLEHSTDWQMDSVIEQIEKQMAAVLEKIEGDMPSLLEQISDRPETLQRAKSAHSSPSSCPRSYHHSTPPPLPTTPRPPLPTLPHLTIPPPSYPPPSPPTHVQAHAHPVSEHADKDGQRGPAQSPRGGAGLSGKGL
ncbi:caM kinase-like vesicle-associated, like isoform X2 [Denticeps clupeoides]|uniref:CaM kinase-like vesicle-associated protein n=2 Tax=Denticeps clupeoides TaxID=299321 RepID=A0AAY4DGJ6_9TELE|nr:caM kinase-like vesicle-associated protein isoform X2 [Denticeps clupeoides]